MSGVRITDARSPRAAEVTANHALHVEVYPTMWVRVLIVLATLQCVETAALLAVAVWGMQ